MSTVTDHRSFKTILDQYGRAMDFAEIEQKIGPRADSGSGSAGFGGFGLGGFGGNYPDGYAGAGWDMRRGYVYFPRLDTTRELSTYSRVEIMRRARWLKRNVGLVRRLIDGTGRMVIGTGLKVQAATTARDWNKLCQKRVDARFASREILDLGGRWNMRASQFGRYTARLTDGDFLTAFVKSSTGGARFRHFEAHQIGTYFGGGQWGPMSAGDGGGIPPATGDGWIDGVLPDRNNRPTKYRVFGNGADDYTDIPASACSYYGKYESVGMLRCSSVLTHAILHLMDFSAMAAAFKRDLLSVADKGIVIEEANAASNDVGGAEARYAAPSTFKVKDPVTGRSISLERLYGGGVIQKLAPGESMKVIADPRPHENNLKFLDYLIRDISFGIGLSPEILWNIVSLGSAATRFVMADAQTFIQSEQQDFVDSCLAREYAFTVACDIASGALPPCPDPEFWKCLVITPPRVTIDWGRDGTLILKQIAAGYISPQRGALLQGMDAYQEGYNRIDWIADMKDYAASKDVTMLEAFPDQYKGLRQVPDADAPQVDAQGNPIPGAAAAAPKKPKKKPGEPDNETPDDEDFGDPDDDDDDDAVPTDDDDDDDDK